MKKFWTEEKVEEELKRYIHENGLESMPPNDYLHKNGAGGLAVAIQRFGGYVFWANKLGIDYATKARKDWNEDEIRKSIKESMAILVIDRMPTSSELHSIGMGTLANTISKTKKYKGWADDLGLSTKNSETNVGVFYEEYTKERLEELGFRVETTSANYAYDLLVDSCVKIDVKAGKSRSYNGFKQASFGINKLQHTCDLYVCVRLDEKNEIETVFVIPSHIITSTTITLGKNSKYDIFIDRWDYVTKYADFFKSMQ